MDIHQKITELIPPNNRTHREGFSNHRLIDKLTPEERIEVENALIEKLQTSLRDNLIIETLSYMKSDKSIPLLKKALETEDIEIQKVNIAACIYKINQEKDMIDIAIKAFKKDTSKWGLISAFYYLKEFNNEKTNRLILNHIGYPDFLVSYNAKRALGLIKD